MAKVTLAKPFFAEGKLFPAGSYEEADLPKPLPKSAKAEVAKPAPVTK